MMFPYHASRKRSERFYSYQALNLERTDWFLLMFLRTPITEKAIDLGVDLVQVQLAPHSTHDRYKIGVCFRGLGS
jgi:hypothetical protein